MKKFLQSKVILVAAQ